MADDADRADDENAVQLEKRIKRMRNESSSRESTLLCIDCEKPIPKERRALMAKIGLTCERCVTCQTAEERLV